MNDLRAQRREKLRQQELEQDMLRRMQMEQKMELLRQQKQEYMLYQQQLQMQRQQALEQKAKGILLLNRWTRKRLTELKRETMRGKTSCILNIRVIKTRRE